MEVRFRTEALRRRYEKQREAKRAWPAKVARRYVERVSLLVAARSGHDLRTLPQLRFHPLADDRLGQFAIDIDGFWRLLVTFEDDAQTKVWVEEVSKHYDD